MKYRTHAIFGHYGSGKTEFSVNYALDLKKYYENVAILDMDIANPYFRSRERQALMEEKGIAIHFNTYGYDISEDLPAITATVRAPLENKEFQTVVDVGGNDSGARIINQFRKYFISEDTRLLAVLNFNRPDSDTIEKSVEQVRSIENEIGIKMTGLINNTHMLRETTTDDILDGYLNSLDVSKVLGIPVVYNTCEKHLLPELLKEAGNRGITAEVLDIPAGFDNGTEIPEKETSTDEIMYVYPISLQMRPTWLDA